METTKEEIKKPANVYDMSIIKNILKKEDMQMMINTEDLATENFFKPLAKDADNISYDSNSTRYMLNKKKINLPKLLLEIGAKLDYISSGATGHTFRGDIIRDNKVIYEFALKASAYPKKKNYGDITNLSRPENAEIMILRVLSYFVVNSQTPHIILPIITFNTDISFFIQLYESKYIKRNIEKYGEFVKEYNNGRYENTVSILLSEWANRGDFLDFARTRYKNFKLLHWKIFFFQILSVLAIIQSKYPSFRHNDMKANNILVQKVNKNAKKFCKYQICDKYYAMQNIGYYLKLCDFDFACIDGVVDNAKVRETYFKEMNITSEKNRYYDMHYFFNTLIRFLPEIINDTEHIPQEVPKFIFDVIPKQYRTGVRVSEKKGRLLVDTEYTTPQKILEEHEFFADFRK